MWILDHLPDLESDFSVFHRIDDIYSMDGPRFFAFAVRLFAYKGMMRAHAEAEAMKNEKTSSTPSQNNATGWQTTSLETASPLLRGERREVPRG